MLDALPRWPALPASANGRSRAPSIPDTDCSRVDDALVVQVVAPARVRSALEPGGVRARQRCYSLSLETETAARAPPSRDGGLGVTRVALLSRTATMPVSWRSDGAEPAGLPVPFAPRKPPLPAAARTGSSNGSARADGGDAHSRHSVPPGAPAARRSLSAGHAHPTRRASVPAPPLARAPSMQGIGAEYASAAEALLRADFLLISAGAGLSADSGLSVYKDIANVPAYASAGLGYADLCSPGSLERSPEQFYGFWLDCFNAYMDTAPHAGYAMLAKWRDAVIGQRLLARARQSGPPPPAGARTEGERSSTFVFTSNVDCAFARAGVARAPGAGVGRAEASGDAGLYEIHGNIRSWQCAQPCARSLELARAVAFGSPAEAAADDAGAAAVWRMPERRRFVVDRETMHAPEYAPAAERAPSEQPPSSPRLRHNHPLCPHCGGAARPAILMFDDDRWLDPGDGGDEYEAWLARVRRALKRDVTRRLVVLELGAGVRVPTVRDNSERLLRRLGAHGTRLVRINTDHPGVRAPLASSTVSISERCLPALEMIDRAIDARVGRAAAAAAAASASGRSTALLAATATKPSAVARPATRPPRARSAAAGASRRATAAAAASAAVATVATAS